MMNVCKGNGFDRGLLGKAVRLAVEREELTFQDARQLADREARKLSPDPMLLAWYDKKAGAFSPAVE